MLSNTLSYQLYTRDMTRTLDRIAADPVVKREAEYYRTNIHSVSTIEEFMGDYRLYSYAMKAYGLEEQIDSRALIKKVLESDLSDTKSLANKLSDERYRTFAKAFSFVSTKEPPVLVAQSVGQTDLIVEAYSEYRTRAGQVHAVAAKGYMDGIGAIGNVDEFLNSTHLFNVALSSVGIDPSVASKSFIRDVLTGNAADGPAANGDNRYADLAAMLGFEPDGSVPAGGLQSVSEANNTVFDYFDEKGLATSEQAAAYQVSYYESEIAKVRTADEFVKDPRLFSMALSSVGLSDSEMPSYAWTLITSDLSDPDSALNQMPEDTPASLARKENYKRLAERLNFDTQGNLAVGEAAQSEAARTATVEGYFANYRSSTAGNDKIATSLFRVAVSGVSTVRQFASSTALYDYALKAFGLDPATESRSSIMRVLRSDPSDPSSYANSLGDERYVNLAAAFNFGESGNLAAQRIAQTEANQIDTATRYAERLGDKPTAAETKAAKEDTTAYKKALVSIVSVDDFVANKTVVDFALKAYGLEAERLSQKDLVAILTSDPSDPESFVNKSGDRRLIEFSAAYAFTPDGGIERGVEEIQSASDFLSTQDFYLRQTMEEEAGADNESVRLSLYFRRMAPDLTSIYEILADPALLTVVQTAVGLPAESSQSNLDLQERTIAKKLDLETLKDPKGLERFIVRYLALQEAQSTSTATSPALAILGSSGGIL
ncbi:DUF1217 domain-containing protein [Aurantimonas sp. A2-1-M11]|uniref:DUF1217 domain-containing protein n=1 Tax=Aurantimonas sp. A2-1-M11 TaxID=3113712 RepID=UPI002F94F961